MLFVILMVKKEIIETFYVKELQKIDQTELRVEK